MKSHSHLPNGKYCTHTAIYMQALLYTEFLIYKFHHDFHKFYQRIISMTHSVTLLLCPETWPRNSTG